MLLQVYISAINDTDDLALFELLYDKYRLLLIDDAYAIVKDQGYAQDIVQEVYMRVAQYMDKIDFAENPMPLLRTVTRNCAINFYHKMKRECGTYGYEEEILIADKLDIASDIENKSDVEMIADYVERMPDGYADVFMLKYMYDLSSVQIAAILDLKASTVRKRIQRMRETITDKFYGVEKDESVK